MNNGKTLCKQNSLCLKALFLIWESMGSTATGVGLQKEVSEHPAALPKVTAVEKSYYNINYRWQFCLLPKPSKDPYHPDP